MDAKTVGIYGTYMAPYGIYVDALVKYMAMKNDFEVFNLQGDYIKGDSMDTDGFGASVEIGKRFHLSADEEGFHVEPQVQLSYLNQNGGDFHTSNGLKGDVDSFTSLLGRIGLLAGYEVTSGAIPFHIYAKVSGVREFDGDIGARLNGAFVQNSFGDSWISYGAGFTVQVHKRHHLYFDFERVSGGHFDMPWAVNGGYRVTF